MRAWLFSLTLFLALPAVADSNPPAEGFDFAGSDSLAIALADSIMEAMGGRAAWDQTRYLSWHFFGRRQHWWDRHTGDVRIEGEDGEGDAKLSYVLLANVERKSGRVFLNGEELTNVTERDTWVQRAYETWVNDSYWVFMPYKLKDSGVTLSYRGKRSQPDYGEVEVLGLRFANVGVTPENRYEVFVDPTSHLVCGWSYFARASDSEPQFTMPWKNWVRVGRILLAADHGREADWQLRAYDSLPESVFRSPEPVGTD